MQASSDPRVERALEQLRLGLKHRSRLRRAGRDFACIVQTGERSVLEALNDGLLDLNRSHLDIELKTYLDALTDVVTAALLEHDREDEQKQLTQTLERPLWREALMALSSGPMRSGALAQALDRDAGQVSRMLSEMRDAHIVSSVVPAPGADGRAKHYRLTSRGRSLAEQASAHEGQLLKAWVLDHLPTLRQYIRDGDATQLLVKVEGPDRDDWRHWFDSTIGEHIPTRTVQEADLNLGFPGLQESAVLYPDSETYKDAQPTEFHKQAKLRLAFIDGRLEQVN